MWENFTSYDKEPLIVYSGQYFSFANKVRGVEVNSNITEQKKASLISQNQIWKSYFYSLKSHAQNTHVFQLSDLKVS